MHLERMKHMPIIYGNTIDIERYFNTHPTCLQDQTTYFEEFDLMRPSFFEDAKEEFTSETGCQYLVYIDEQEQPLGVLKWKRYGLPHHQFIREEEAYEANSYLAIRLVDVKTSERNKGIALSLVRAFTKRHGHHGYVVGGKATPSGNIANIHDWMKRELSQTYYISESDLVDDWEEENDCF